MRPGILLVLTMLALVGGPNGSFAQNANVDVGIANTGIQTFHEAVTIGLTPDQVRQMMLDLRQRDSLDAERAAELAREVDQLSTEIGVRKPAVESFLRILGEAQVPVEALNEKLAEIAQRHMDMLERWSVLEEEDDPAIRERTDVAKAAIDAGDYDRADELLAEAEELDLVAARQAQELEVQARAAANRRFLAAAAKRAKRGELRLTRLDYPGAAGHFKAAAELVPAEETLVLANYLMREGSALDDAGRYWEAEKSVERALAIMEKALGAEHPEVATTLNNLAKLYYSSGDYPAAEPLYHRAIEIFTEQAGEGHPTLAWLLNNLALLYTAQARYADAKPLYEQALAIYEALPPPALPRAATVRQNYSAMLEKMNAAQK